jgi:DNA-binding response OmpR family regulator
LSDHPASYICFFLQSFYKLGITLPLLVRSINRRGQVEEGIVGSGQAAGKSIPPYRDEHLKIDFDQEAALLDDGRMALTRKEYDLLALLVEHAGEIIPREALLMRVWGYGGEVKTRTLDVHIRRLRKKLGQFAEQYIETIFGIGYRFQPYHAPRFMQSGSAKPAVAVTA